MRVLIVGAGIGGLTAALALRQAGFDTMSTSRPVSCARWAPASP